MAFNSNVNKCRPYSPRVDTFRELVHPDLRLCWRQRVALHVPLQRLRSGCGWGVRSTIQATTFCHDHYTSLPCTLATSSRLFCDDVSISTFQAFDVVMHPEFFGQFPDSLMSLFRVAKKILLYLVSFIKVLMFGLVTYRFDLLTDVWGIFVTHFHLSSQFHLTENFLCLPWFVLRSFSPWQLVFRFIHRPLHRRKVFPIF